MQPQNITAASHEFFNRPKDEEYPTLDDLIHAAQRRKEFSVVENVDLSTARISPNSPFTINGSEVTPWAFIQLSQRLSFPADFVRKLSLDTMLRVLREQQRRVDEDRKIACAMVSEPPHGGMREIRAILTPRYERVWDADLFSRVQRCVGDTLKPAGHIAGGRSASGGNNRGMSAAQGRSMGLAQRSGLYSSDRNTFAFLVNPSPLPGPDGGDQKLYRGVIIGNSETGERRLFAWFFAFDSLCANHIIWGAQQQRTISLRHIGKKNVAEGLDKIEHVLETWCALTPEAEVERITNASRTPFAADADECEKKLRAAGFAVGVIDNAAVHAQDRAKTIGTDPFSVWGVASGLTRAAQDIPHAGDRIEVETMAGELLQEAVAV